MTTGHKALSTILVGFSMVALIVALASHRWFVERDNDKVVTQLFGLYSSIEKTDDDEIVRTNLARAKAMATEHTSYGYHGPSSAKVADATWFWRFGIATYLLTVIAILGLGIGIVAVYWPNRFTHAVAASRLSGLSARSVTRFALVLGLVTTFALTRFAPANVGLAFWIFEFGVAGALVGNHLLAKHVVYVEREQSAAPSPSKQIGTGLAIIAMVALVWCLGSRQWFAFTSGEDSVSYGLWSSSQIVDDKPVVRSNHARVAVMREGDYSDEAVADAEGFWKAGIVVLAGCTFGILGLGLGMMAVYRPNRVTRRISPRGLTALALVIALTATFKLVANKPAAAENALWAFFVFSIIGLIANEILAKEVLPERLVDPDELDEGELPSARLRHK